MIQSMRRGPHRSSTKSVDGIRHRVDNRTLRPGTRLPSIRRFAADHEVSAFTVVQAYDRLVACGYAEPRQRSGFFVSAPSGSERPPAEDARRDQATSALWLMRHQASDHRHRYAPGGDWLPRTWLMESGLDAAMREVSRRGIDATLSGHGDPMGFAPLREQLSRRLSAHGIDASPNQIMLTNGLSGGIDLVARYLVRPDDVVLVDDPGHFRRFAHMRALGATVEGVPMTRTGPDLDQLEAIARTRRPRLYITAPIVHNPTGCTISQAATFRLLNLAERYDFHIIEDDSHGVVHPAPPPRLAGLDGLNRVVYVNSFSVVLSARLRVGLLAGHADFVQDLTNLKLLTQVASSESNERQVHEVLAHGQFRKYRAQLIARVHRARVAALRRLEAIGLGPADDDTHGLFAWLDVPGVADTGPLAEAAAKRGMLLAPGAMSGPTWRRPRSCASTSRCARATGCFAISRRCCPNTDWFVRRVAPVISVRPVAVVQRVSIVKAGHTAVGPHASRARGHARAGGSREDSLPPARSR